MMFGVSLNLRPSDFARIIRSPVAPTIGLLAQVVLLPLGTFLLTLLLKPDPSLALGMILVACCPGGNFSNIVAFLARANLAVSVSMTAVSSVLAIFTTPILFSFYADASPATAALMQEISLNRRDMVALVALVIGLPILLGMAVGGRFPKFRDRSEGMMRIVSVIIFFGFVALAFAKNWESFAAYYDRILLLVVMQNSLALLLGFALATLFRQTEQDRRAITLEVGIQNSGLGLTLLFTFMPQLGGAILIAAFWGIWHLVSGLILAGYWGRYES
jgi:BASS family bile acid:Na+ symporter